MPQNNRRQWHVHNRNTTLVFKERTKYQKIYEVFQCCAGKPFSRFHRHRIAKDRAEGKKAILEKFLNENPNYCSIKTQKMKDDIALQNYDIMLGERPKIEMNSFYGKIV